MYGRGATDIHSDDKVDVGKAWTNEESDAMPYIKLDHDCTVAVKRNIFPVENKNTEHVIVLRTQTKSTMVKGYYLFLKVSNWQKKSRRGNTMGEQYDPYERLNQPQSKQTPVDSYANIPNGSLPYVYPPVNSSGATLPRYTLQTGMTPGYVI